MSDAQGTTVPVWTLATTAGVTVPAFGDEGGLTAQRLTELRAALSAFASAPLVTLEAHPLTARRGRVSAGLSLDGMSPLARELSRLLTNSSNTPAVQEVTQSSEILYRMHVPAKVASKFSQGLVKPMTSKAVDGGVYGDLVTGAGTRSIVAKATYVPVEVPSAGATGSGVKAVAASTGAGAAITVAAPLVLMAVALGASAYADHEQQRAIESIAKLLDKLHDDNLEAERSELDGCRDAIDKATALLLDRGKVGSSLGLDSAVHAISTATWRAETRAGKWAAALDAIREDNHVDVAELEDAFPGVSEGAGEFLAHVEMAALAIALKRRVIILQAVESGQSDEDNPFENFVRSLRDDQQRVNALDARIAGVLTQLSSLELHSPKRLIDKVMTRNQVDALLDTSYRLRDLAPSERANTSESDVVIDIEKHRDGTLLVLPARAS